MNLIPTVIEKSRDGERSYDIYSRLLKDRIIFVGGGIDSAMANTIIAQLLFLDSQDSNKDIKLYVNSPGGSIYAGMAIIDTMNHVKSDVSTIAIGTAASMGAMILAAGKKGKRFALPNAKVLIHQPLMYGLEGQASDIEIATTQLLKDKDQLLSYLAKWTGQRKSKIEKDADRDYWMGAKEAAEYGLIDKVIK